jgi:hypothetical protein
LKLLGRDGRYQAEFLGTAFQAFQVPLSSKGGSAVRMFLQVG